MEVFSNMEIILAAVALALSVVLLIVVMVLQNRTKRLEQRVSALSSGADGESLEDMLINIFESYNGINHQLEQNTDDIRDINCRMHFTVQKVGIIKYDAFKQMGGNLSSVIAFLDQDNNGFLLNTVQNIDGCYSYVKEVRNGRSDVELTDEEQDAMEMAIEGHRI